MGYIRNCHRSNVGVDPALRYGAEIFAGEDGMELAIVTVLLIVGASLIPGDYHIVFFR
jgi:hypothetical protein